MLFYVVLPCQFCKYDVFVPFNSSLCLVMMVILLHMGCIHILVFLPVVSLKEHFSLINIFEGNLIAEVVID